MVWVAEDEPHPKVLKTGFRSRKRMFTNFFNTQGPVVVDMMPQQSYNHCRILHNYFSFTKSSSSYSVHGTDSTSVSNPVASRQHSSPQSSHYTDVPWWQWYPFDGTSIILTRLGFVRFLALSKSQISPRWEAFFKDPRPCSTCACRDESHTCFRVPRMLSEVQDEDAAIYRSRGKLLWGNVTVILEIAGEP